MFNSVIRGYALNACPHYLKQYPDTEDGRRGSMCNHVKTPAEKVEKTDEDKNSQSNQS